jgi:replicative DNA helicase
MSKFRVDAKSSLQDKLPPQDLDAERSLLGSMLLSQDAIDDVADMIQPSHFYSDAHIRIAEVIFKLAETSIGGIDAVTVASELDRRGDLEQIGGAPYLGQVLETVPHAAHARYYAEIVRDKYVRRSLRDACTMILKEISEDSADTEELLSHAEERVFQILDKEGDTQSLEIRDILEYAMTGIHARVADDGSISGTRTGFDQLDGLTSGFQPGGLIIVAARPSMGKTAFVCNLAKHVAVDAHERYSKLESPKKKHPEGGIVIFSLEQSKQELAEPSRSSRPWARRSRRSGPRSPRVTPSPSCRPEVPRAAGTR